MATRPVDPQTDFLSVLCTTSKAVSLAADQDLTTYFSDGNGLTFPFARRLYVGTGGTVVGRLYGDTVDTTRKNVPSGSYLDGAWITVRSTANGTTAADIVAER